MEIPEISEIRPGLWLGGGKADDLDLHQAKVEYVVQVNYEKAPYTISSLKGHSHFPLPNKLIYEWNPDLIEKILERFRAYRLKGPVLLHCMFGRDRSANIMYLYLRACGMSWKQAIELLEQKRPIVSVPRQTLIPDELFEPLIEKLNSRWFPSNKGEKDVPVHL